MLFDLCELNIFRFLIIILGFYFRYVIV